MGYLNEDDLYRYNIIDYNDEKLLLLEPAGPKQTFVMDSFERSDGEYIDLDAEVFIKQRWKVDVLPEIPFGSGFTTVRAIEYYCCDYSTVLQKQKQEDILKRVYIKNKIPYSPLTDNFDGIL